MRVRTAHILHIEKRAFVSKYFLFFSSFAYGASPTQPWWCYFFSTQPEGYKFDFCVSWAANVCAEVGKWGWEMNGLGEMEEGSKWNFDLIRMHSSEHRAGWIWMGGGIECWHALILSFFANWFLMAANESTENVFTLCYQIAERKTFFFIWRMNKILIFTLH